MVNTALVVSDVVVYSQLFPLDWPPTVRVTSLFVLKLILGLILCRFRMCIFRHYLNHDRAV